MKNLLFYLLFLSTSIHAQWTDFTDLQPSKYSNNDPNADREVRLMADDLGLTVLRAVQGGFMMLRYEPSGQLETFYNLGNGSRLGQFQQVGTSYFMSTFENDCDVPLGKFFRCIDSTGNLLWQHHFEIAGEWDPYHFIPATTGNWWLWQGNQFPQLIDGISGTLVDTLSVTRPAIRNYLILSDGQVVAYSDDGLLRYNGDFELTGTALSGQGVEELYQSGDRLLAYGAGRLYLLNDALEVLAEANISQLTGAGRIQLAMRGDHVFVSRFMANSAKWIEFDQSLQLVTQANYPDQAALQPQGFTLFNDRWLIAGTNQTYMNVVKSVAAPYPGYQHNMDVELRSVVATDSMEVELTYAPFNDWVAVQFKADSVWATVKNNSPIAIDRFRLSWYTNIIPVWWCDTGFENSMFYEQPLAPSDSVTVLVENVGYTYSTTVSQLTNVFPQVTIPFFVDMPQDSIDINKSNGYLAALLQVETVVPATVAFEPNEVSIYPNPIKEVLFIEVQNKVFDVEIYDKLGRLVHRAVAKNGQYRWDRGHTPAGMYWVRVVAGPQAGVYKLLGL
jgi:Secretion system C-terminal sorting domain